MAGAYLKWMELRAETLVEANWRFVDAFARRLLAQNTLSYAEIGEIVTNEINASHGGQSTAFRILSATETTQRGLDDMSLSAEI